jgi:chromosome segregation protein
MNPLKQSSPTPEEKPVEPLQTPSGGAAWHRLDLHLHSPCIRTFKPPRGTKREGLRALADPYIEQLATQGISIAALTDHNGINREWFEVAAAKAINRGIIILPGAEMAFREGASALHLLAVFPGDTDLKDVNAFLQSLDQDPATPLTDNQGSHRNIELKVSLTDALKELRSRFNCLLVLPHPDQANGLFKSLAAEDAARLLLEVRPDAIEYCPEEEKKKLQATGVLPQDFWKRLAFVEFSNPKRIEEIGTQHRTDGTLRATYLKLSATDLDALRLALHTPETRLSIGGIPPEVHPKIRCLTVSGSGFLGNLSISWSPDLNVIIGGKGVGKSALLETLRYAFAIAPHSDPSACEDSIRHALGNDGKVEVLFDRPLRDGKTHQYRIARSWGEDPRIYQVNPEKPLLISPAELLSFSGGASFFGPGEIDAVSGSEAYWLALLDESIGDEARKCSDAMNKAIEALVSNTGAILEGQAALAKRDEYGQRLKGIEDEIKIHQRQVADKLKKVTDLRGVGEVLQNARNTVSDILADCETWRFNLLTLIETAHQGLTDLESSQTGFPQEGATILAVLQESLKVVLDDERTLFEQAMQSLTRLDIRYQEKLRPLEEESKRLEQDAQREPMGQDRLLSLTEERTSLASHVEEWNGIEDRLKTLTTERQGLLQRLKDCRFTQTGLRRERADAIAESLRGRLHLQIEPKGQKESYKEQLSLLLKGSNLPEEAIELLVAPEATDGIALAEAVRTGSKEVQTCFGLEPEMADRLIRWLTADDSRLFELETLIPQDGLHLRLKMEGQYQPFEHLSASQGASAFLLLLLGLGSRILVIDQPEDYLADRSVHEEVLQTLREQKGLKDPGLRRQVIVTTNDATLPVMADAELVIPLEVREDQAHVIGQASIDDRSLREMIEATLENGQEVFKQCGL